VFGLGQYSSPVKNVVWPRRPRFYHQRHSLAINGYAECQTRLSRGGPGGRSRSLVLWGEAGIGKTALLERLVESVSGLPFLRGSGVESEMELAYASLSPGAVDTEMLRTANPNFARSSRASIVRPRGPASGRCCSARPDASGQRVQLIGHVAGAEDVGSSLAAFVNEQSVRHSDQCPGELGQIGLDRDPGDGEVAQLRYPRSADRRRCGGSRPCGWVGGSSGFGGGIGHCTDWPEVRVIGSPWWWMSSVSPVSRV